MNFSYYIAKRYLFTKTSNNTINIITIIASFGVIVGSLALFIVLSGYSGIKKFSYSLLDVSDPDIKITSSKGKSFLFSDEIQQIIHNDAAIAEYSKVIEERVFLKYRDRDHIAHIKGVDEKYNTITQIDSSLFMGSWLDFEYTNTAVIGYGISEKLSLGVQNFGDPLQILIPKKGKRFINPQNPYHKIEVQILGVYKGTQEFEQKFVFTNIEQAKKLVGYQNNQITGIEIKLNENSDPNFVAKNLQKNLGKSIKVHTKAQLNEVYYKVINTENFVSYLIFTLIIIIALFNVISAIIMMIIDKKSNLKTLLNLGMTVSEIKKVFLIQGFLLTFFGMILGLSIGIILVTLQQQFGWFMITATLPYPVEFQFFNLFLVIATILILGFIASKIASSSISKKFIK